MRHAVIVGGAPLFVQGAMVALAGVEDWEVREGDVAHDADAWVLGGDEITIRGATGANAQLSANATADRLRAAVRAVLAGLSVREAPWPAEVQEHEPLTPRELEVFELIAKGLSNRDIASALGISAHTAKYHVGQILAKVGAATRAEAVSAGLRAGLIGL
ncbi:MAG: helix-turn-helix domain-containing protein [Burkholderiaceae bacterium]